MLVVICILFGCRLPPLIAAVNIDVEMRLNDGGFISYDHFRAELYLNNLDRVVSDASIFGILEIMGEFFFWPSFSSEVDFGLMDIKPGETLVNFLAFDFGDIDDFIPFGPMRFWGAWFLDMETWNYDSQEFWLGLEHRWTPTPTSTPGPTNTPRPTNTPTMEGFIYIPPGVYQCGDSSDEPCAWQPRQHQVTLTRGLEVMKTEVTRLMWAKLRAVEPYLPSDPSQIEISPTMNHPVQKVTWFEAVLFANLQSVRHGFTRCYYKDAEFTEPVDVTNYTSDSFYCDFDANGYRLPTSAEWEYVCRAGSTGSFPFYEPKYGHHTCGSCNPQMLIVLVQYSVYCANSAGTARVVGSKLPNPWGLYDMHGNVCEWVWDWYELYSSEPVVDPTGPETGSYRVMRGGDWNCSASGCRSASREWRTPGYSSNNLGFRLVRSSSN